MVKILLTGGGSGGHIYPLLAVSDAIGDIPDVEAQLSYVGPKSLLNQEFTDRDTPVYRITSSKWRRYPTLKNFLDIPKFLVGIIQAFFLLYRIMPDVVFSKGGPGALPIVIAAKFYFIPVIIHESDAIPGFTNRISARFAKRIAISFKEASEYFTKNKVALTGNPIRSELLKQTTKKQHAMEQLRFDPNIPLLVILGGSQGASQLNDFVFDSANILIKDVQILHQVGEKNLEDARRIAYALMKELGKSAEGKYRAVGYLSVGEMGKVLSASDIVISRAGAGAIFEISLFGKPSILVPLDSAANGHQKANAYSYAKTGAAIVIESENLKPHVVALKIKEILQNKELYASMERAARQFVKPDAASVIANEIIKLGGKHTQSK